MGEQYVGIDLHRRGSVIVRITPAGEVLQTIRVDNDPWRCRWSWPRPARPRGGAGGTHGWYWAADLLQASGARCIWPTRWGQDVRLPAGQDRRPDSRNLAELLHLGRLPEAWLAPPQVRELRELVRYRAKLVALRSGSRPRSMPCSPRKACGCR